jgi:hypothetical protein
MSCKFKVVVKRGLWGAFICKSGRVTEAYAVTGILVNEEIVVPRYNTLLLRECTLLNIFE